MAKHECRGWDTKLPLPLPTTDGMTITTLNDARSYMLRLPASLKRRDEWQCAAALLMAAGAGGHADAVEAARRQLELALFLNARLRLASRRGRARAPRGWLAPLPKQKR